MNKINAAGDKKFDDFYLTDSNHKKHRFVRSSRKKKGFFDVEGYPVLTDRSIEGNNGVVPDAIWYSDEEVAELVAQHEEYQGRLKRAETSLRQWVDFRESWSRNGRRKLKLQRKEVPQ